MTEAMPAEIDGWVVVAELGGGDFATVYRVQKEGNEGALKRCHSEGEVGRQRHSIEVNVLREFDHPGIPSLLAQSGETELPYFVMSIAPGRTLREIIAEWSNLGRVFGQLEALEIAVSLLESLSYIHEKDYVHRDIKDANVIVDIDRCSAYLVDFGFCKRTGTSETRTTDSFWRVGNARFAPPSKIRQPGTAAPSHDVFAVGVLVYRMLTGLYPWSVGENEDYSVLLSSMAERALVPVAALNSTISDRVSRFVTRLLNLEDSGRPRSRDAAEEAREILKELKSRVRISTPPRIQGLQYEHVVRDNIHGDIRLTDYEYNIINCPEMQRLRRIKQLGLTNLVYVGAEHSRLAHSIGTLDRVEVMLRAIEDQSGLRIETATRQAARIFALVHDVCHIPMGHTIEDELGLLQRHDQNTARFDRLVASEASELGRLLRSTPFGTAVQGLLNPDDHTAEDEFIYQAVSGVAGADVLDYVDRDATHCGLDHRVDSAIFRQLRLHERPQTNDRRIVFNTGGKFGLRVDRQFAVESLLLERYALFLKVYTHSSKIAADAVLGKALHEQFSGGKKNTMKDDMFDSLGDEGLIRVLLASRREVVKEMGERLSGRKLPRAVYRGRVLEMEVARQHGGYTDAKSLLDGRGFTTAAGRTDIENKISRKSGIDRNRLFFYLPKTAPGYKRARHWSAESAESPVEREPSHSGDISSRHLALWEAWLFVSEPSPEESAKAASACQEIVGFENVASKDRRPSLF